jgi:hypothetical protein
MSFRSKLIICSLGITAAWAQVPPPPGSLNVVSATSKQVQLSWTAASGAKSYAVQRKPLIVTSDGIPGDSLTVSAGSYSTAVTVTDVSTTDKTIDPYTTYTYCVIAVNDSGQSGCSNEVTVGPPPVGFNVIVATTPGTAARFATVTRMELDANGDPAMSYVNVDPNGDGDESDNALYFASWNRARYQWNAPVLVAANIGHGEHGGISVPVSQARDADSGVWGVAYAGWNGGVYQMVLTTSADGGATWTTRIIASDPNSLFMEPSLAMWHGSFYLAYVFGTYKYVTGKLADDPKKWMYQDVPMPGGYLYQYNSISLALDSSHNPGIAFLVANDSTETPALWRPASSNPPVIICPNDGWTNENSDVQLTFFGTEPRITSDFVWNYDLWRQDEDHNVWAMRGVGDGSNWLPPVNIPSEGNLSVYGSLSIATGSQGQTAIVMTAWDGGAGNGVCGLPKLARSADFVTFQTCAPAPLGNPDFEVVDFPVVKFWGNDKLWLAFHNYDTWGQLGTGLVLWREP